MKTKSDLIERAQSLNLSVATWSPGDGMTRYRFFQDEDAEYFADEPLYTALGLKEAFTWLSGYAAGKRDATK